MRRTTYLSLIFTRASPLSSPLRHLDSIVKDQNGCHFRNCVHGDTVHSFSYLYRSALHYVMIQTRIRFVSEIYALNALWALAMLSTRCAHRENALNTLCMISTGWEHQFADLRCAHLLRDVHNALRASPIPTTRWGHVFRSQSEFGFGS